MWWSHSTATTGSRGWSGSAGGVTSDARFVTVTKARGGVEGDEASDRHANTIDDPGPGVGERRCRWCARRLPEPASTGRPRLYCRRSCRQRAFEARRRLDELTWGDDRLRDLTQRMDDQYVVLAAVRDVVEEMACDVEDGRPWDVAVRDEHIRQLSAVLGDPT